VPLAAKAGVDIYSVCQRDWKSRPFKTESRVPTESHVDLFSDAVLTGIAVAGGKLTG
jgi:hypothetical protein